MTEQTTVLVVDDEPAILHVMETVLRARGYRVSVAATGEDGVSRAALDRPDVIILDLALPDIDGVAVCRRIRAWSDVPIIVLSIEGAETRKVEALDEGANDFVTKPFGMAELMARIRVAVRSHSRSRAPETGSVLELGGLRIDIPGRRAQREGQALELTDTEFRILVELVANADKVLTHNMLLDRVWGPGYAGERHYLRVYVNRLRKKLEPDPSRPRLLVTVPRVGYRLDSGDDQLDPD